MAWGNKTQIANNLAVAGTELFSGEVALNPGETAHVQVVGNNAAANDQLVINVYATLDDTTEEWDNVPIFSQLLDTTPAGDQILSLVMTDVYKFRLGFVRDGNSDTITTNAYQRVNGINV